MLKSESKRGTKVVILLCVTGLARVALLMAPLVGFNWAVNTQEKKTCARQPGQKTKPKCGSSKMKRNLSKKEEDSAFRRKNRQDGNPDRKGKAINVATEKEEEEEMKTF